MDIWTLKNGKILVERTQGCAGDSPQPLLLFAIPAKEGREFKEEEIYFLMKTSETSPSEVRLLQLAERASELVCQYWLKVAGGKKTPTWVCF